MRAVLLATPRRFHEQAGVVLEDGKLDAFHRRATQIAAILLVIPQQELPQINGAGWKARLKGRLDRVRGAFIPRANILADVTAVQPIRKLTADRLVKWRAVLDVQIGNASAGIELIRLGDRVRGAGVDATRARAASIDGRLIGRKRKRGDDLAQKDPRADV